MRFGEGLRYLREQNGLTREEAAEKIDVSRQTIYNWECGKIVPKMEYILRISKSYGISVNELLHFYDLELGGNLKDEPESAPEPVPEPAAELPPEPVPPAPEITDTKRWRLSLPAVCVAIMLCILVSVMTIMVGIYSFHSHEEGRDIVPIEDLESREVDNSNWIEITLTPLKP